MPHFSIEATPLNLNLRHTFSISRGSKKTARNILVRLRGDDGVTGLGEAAPNERYNEDQGKVLEGLQNLPGDLLDDIEAGTELTRRLDETLPGLQSAKAAVEMAWLDWRTQKEGVPLWKYFKSASNTGPVTSYTIGLDTIEQMQQKAAQAGPYPILKVKLGTERDRDIIRALREVTDKPIRVDANEGWRTLKEAMAMVEFLADHNVELVEQPMPAAQTKDMAELKRVSRLPLLADESFTGKENMEEIAKAFDGINIKLMKTGSVLRARTYIRHAKELGLSVMVGCMIESSIANTAAAHIALQADYADLDGHLLVEGDPFKGLQLDSQKRIHLPDRPGLGVISV
ncbi:MAG: dipeptide epimerase [Balneolaceae bacterium]